MPPIWRKHRNYIWILPLCAAALLYQVTYCVVAVNDDVHGAKIPDTPFSTSDGTVQLVSKAAEAAGLHKGDRVVSINGRAFNNSRVPFEEVSHRRPGDLLTITEVPKGQTRARTLQVPVDRRLNAPLSGGEIAAKFVLLLVFLLCVLIAVYMVLRRPHDKRALTAFALLLSLSQVVNIAGWQSFPPSLWVFANVWMLIVAMNWGFAIAAFGLYFPEQFIWDRKRPWLKWLYLVPAICIALGAAFVSLIPQFSFEEHRALLSGPGRFVPVIASIITTISVALFFACIGVKEAKAKKSDVKRRLRLLEVGAAVGLGPIGIFLLYLLISKADVQDLQTPLLVLCVLFLVFPLSLAYTVLTERAMELRVVIRQGMRYALARGGLRVVIFAVCSLLFWRLSVAVSKSQMSDTSKILVLGLTIVAIVFVIRRLRSQLFNAIDKKFFREHYEAEAVLFDLSEHVRTIVDEKQLFETVTRCVSDALHISHSCVLVNNEGLLRPVFAAGLAVPDRAELSEDAKAVSVVAESKEPPPVYFDRHDNWVHTTPECELVTLKALGAQLLLPLKSKDRILGLLCLGPKLSEEPFSKTDINLLRSVALQTGLALENSRLTAAVAQEIAQRERLNREIEIAREVQERLFPQRLPVVAGVDYCGACRPALGVGGDYYDFLSLPDGDLGIAIGDVSGKGIAAALLMASLQASLRGQALTGTTDLAHLMSNVNRLVYEATPANRYATFFYGQYSQQTRTFRYVNAGHNPPFVLRRTSDSIVHVIRLDTGGPVVGLFVEVPYQQGAFTLEPGDIFVAFTDGISEAMNRADEEWGEEQLIPAATAHAEKPAAEMIPHLMADADRFADGAPQHDDMTLVVVKMQPEPALA